MPGNNHNHNRNGAVMSGRAGAGGAGAGGGRRKRKSSAAAAPGGTSAHHRQRTTGHTSNSHAAAAALLAGAGGAAQTASLGERDMMTYVPPGSGSSGGSGGSALQAQQSSQQAQAQHSSSGQHELSLADDAALTAMSADLFDIFGDSSVAGRSVGSGGSLNRGGAGGGNNRGGAGAAVLANGISDLSQSDSNGSGSGSGSITCTTAGKSGSNSSGSNGNGDNNSNPFLSNLPVGASELSWRLHGGLPPQSQQQQPVLAAHPGAPAQQAQQQAQAQAQAQAMAAAQAQAQLDPLFTFAASQFNVTPQQVVSSAAAAQQAMQVGGVDLHAGGRGGGRVGAGTPSLQQQQPQLNQLSPMGGAIYSPMTNTPMISTSKMMNIDVAAAAAGGMGTKYAAGTKRPLPPAIPDYAAAPKSMVSEDGSDRVKRRRDRNAREQQRSQQITVQINHLRDVLTESNVSFKPDKYSTLVGVADYIKSLRSRKALLDEEHAKLLDTIRRTSDVMTEAGSSSASASPGGGSCSSSPNDFSVGGGFVATTAATSAAAGSVASASMMGGGGNISNAVIPNTIGGSRAMGGEPWTTSSVAGSSLRSTSSPEDELLVFVRGLDYKNIFSSCGIALGIAAIDGRLVDCNDEFVALSGRDRADLVGRPGEEGQKMSLFNLLGREGMEGVFTAMSDMLRSVPIPGDEPDDDGSGAPSSLSSSDESPRESSGRAHGSSGRPNPGRPPHHVTFADNSGGATGGGVGGGAPGQIICQRSRPNPMDHWSGIVTQSGRKDHRLRLNLTLVRSSDSRPKFFNCALSHLPEI